MEFAIHSQEEALQSLGQHESLISLRLNYDEVQQALRFMHESQSVIHPIMVPIGQKAFMRGHLAPGNPKRVTMHIGEEYFMECTLPRAMALMRKRQNGTSYLQVPDLFSLTCEEVEEALDELEDQVLGPSGLLISPGDDSLYSAENGDTDANTESEDEQDLPPQNELSENLPTKGELFTDADGFVEIREEYYSDDEVQSYHKALSAEITPILVNPPISSTLPSPELDGSAPSARAPPHISTLPSVRSSSSVSPNTETLSSPSTSEISEGTNGIQPKSSPELSTTGAAQKVSRFKAQRMASKQ